MKKTSYSYIQHNRLAGLCKKFNNRINRFFSQGRFEKIKLKLFRFEGVFKLSASVFAVGLLMGSTNLHAQAPQAGDEFRVTPVAGTTRASAAMNKNTGDFIVVWQETNGVYAHRYNASGTSQGTDFLISGSGRFPSVAMDREGDFVVAYHRTNGSSDDVFARRYNANGQIQGTEFIVNTNTTSNQTAASVAMDSDGDFVITWQSRRGIRNAVSAQRYSAAGVPQGSEFYVNTYTLDTFRPDIAMDDIGNFVIVWQSGGQDDVNAIVSDFDWGIYAQRFDATGTVQGGEFLVNTVVQGNQANPSIAMDSDGDFVVTWEAFSNAATPTTVSAIIAQRFNAAAISQDSEFQVNVSNAAFGYWDSDVAMENDGDFVVTWASHDGQDGSKQGVYAKRYDAAGIILQSDFLVNTYTNDDQALPSIAMNDFGEYVIAWESENQDLNGYYSLYAKRYILNQTPIISNQAFSVAENSINGTSIGSIVASDPDVGQILTYTIIAGNTDGKFTINSSTGEITIAGSVDYEIVSSYLLTVQVTDNGNPSRKATSAITVNVTNVHEAPVATPQNFSVTENGVGGTIVGTLAFTVEPGLTGTYSITGGNIGGAFSINANTGVLTQISSLNYEAIPSYALTVKITDNGSPALSASAVINITVIDVNDMPIILSQTFSIAENSANGTFVGKVLASDPDVGQILTYSIGGGNIDNVFSINSSSGEITVNNSIALDYENRTQYLISVQVTDNGSPVNGRGALMTINLSNVYELPVIENQILYVSEKYPFTAIGTVAGSADEGIEQFAIIDGNTDNTFSINSGTGLISLNKPLNYNHTSTYNLTVQLTDTHVPPNSASAVITINVTEELRVNAFGTYNQITPAMAMDDAGNFVITWASQEQDGSGYGIYAQRYSAGGIYQNIEFKVNTYTTNNQLAPAIAMNNNTGDFVIAWSSPGQDGSGFGVFAQRYNAQGVKQGTEFKINMTNAGSQQNASIAMTGNGDFVVAWQSYQQDGNGEGIYARIFNASGVAKTNEFNVNTYYLYDQMLPSVAMDGFGNFIVSWTSYGQDASGSGVYAKRFNASGVAVGNEFKVNIFQNGDQGHSSVAMDNTGDFIITWSSDGQDGDGSGIFAQRYSASGLIQGAEFKVNDYTIGAQGYPSISMNNNDFIITWQSQQQDGSGIGVYAKGYKTSGVTNVPEFKINSYTIDDQSEPSITMNNNGNIAVAWQSNNQDGSDFGIYFRWIGNTAPSAITPQTFSIIENSMNGASVGIVVASDADAGQLLNYSIVAGNQAGKFSINSSTGEITVAGELNHSITSSYNLTIVVTDNGSPIKNNTVAVIINVTTATGIFSSVGYSPILIYPNPASQSVQIDVDGEFGILVLNLAGQVIKEETLKNKILNIEGVKAGVYMIVITQNDTTTIQKLIVE